jgi:hypothetical protein
MSTHRPAPWLATQEQDQFASRVTVHCLDYPTDSLPALLIDSSGTGTATHAASPHRLIGHWQETHAASPHRALARTHVASPHRPASTTDTTFDTRADC